MSTGFVTAPVKGQVTVLWNFLCLGGKNLMAFFSEQYRLLESVFSSLQSVSLYLSSFPELQSDTKYVSSFVLQCKDKSYCSQYAFKFETTQGTNFLLSFGKWICTQLLNLHTLHVRPLLQTNLPGVMRSDQKKMTLLYSFDISLRFVVRNQYFY